MYKITRVTSFRRISRVTVIDEQIVALEREIQEATQGFQDQIAQLRHKREQVGDIKKEVCVICQTVVHFENLPEGMKDHTELPGGWLVRSCCDWCCWRLYCPKDRDKAVRSPSCSNDI